MSLGIGSRFHSFDFSLAIKYEVSYRIFGFIVPFIPYVTGHTGVGTLAGHRL